MRPRNLEVIDKVCREIQKVNGLIRELDPRPGKRPGGKLGVLDDQGGA